jgi:hypothetical protein
MTTHDIDPIEWQAWLDGELDDAACARIEAALAADPALVERAARDRRLRARLREAYDPVLDEPMPARFEALLATSTDSATGDNVVPLPSRPASPHRAPRWREGLGYAMAAALAVVAIGGWWRHAQTTVLVEGGDLVAGGALARGLDEALAGAPDAKSPVAIGLTFRDRDGHICRSFSMGTAPHAGLACRENGRWSLHALEGRAVTASDGEWRQAAAEMPPGVRAAVDDLLEGEALDAAQERVARDAGWR